MIDIRHGDCIAVMQAMEDACVDAIVTDPPYELGFMGKGWDATGIANSVEMWTEAYRVLKPGGHLLAFSGTRTYHRMACAIEDAGFEVRDQIGWLYGTGFPKSLDVSKAIDKAAGAEREVVGFDEAKADRFRNSLKTQNGGWDRPWMHAPDAEMRKAGITAPATPEAQQWAGWGTALKPAWEPICVARKPLIGTVAANVLQHGTGALNIDACRVATDESTARPSGGMLGIMNDDGWKPQIGMVTGGGTGRWPANIIHDGSDEVLAAFAAFGERPSKDGADKGGVRGGMNNAVYGKFAHGTLPPGRGDTGTAARFFYSAKASKADRAGSKHPTVKPISLMRYLCRLVTPPGGTVLDMFAGSGTTLQAALEEGFSAIGIEQSEEYVNDIRRRIAVAREGLGLFAAAAE